MQQIKPFVGETVMYVQADDAKPVNGSREHPAIVTRVWSDGVVNLQVMYDTGPIWPATSVARRDITSANNAHWYRPVTEG